MSIHDPTFLIESVFLFQTEYKLWERFDGKNVNNGVMSSIESNKSLTTELVVVSTARERSLLSRTTFRAIKLYIFTRDTKLSRSTELYRRIIVYKSCIIY